MRPNQFMLVFLTVIFLSNSIFSQSQIRELSLNTVPFAPKTTELQREVLDHFKVAFKKNDIELNYEADFELLISVEKLESSDEVLLSITTTQSLGIKAIEAASKNELFYAHKAEKSKLPEEGKFVREMVTSEWMYNFRMPVDNALLKIKENQLGEVIQNFMNDLRIEFHN
jgi:hypothetical protein